MPAAIPAIIGAAATAAVGGATAVFTIGSFAITGATFGAVVGGIASIATASIDRPQAPCLS